jgi:hypothetical protein
MTDLFWHLAALERWTRCCERVPTRVAYEYILANYVLPKWGPSSLQSIKAVSIEDLLRSLAKANGTKAKIREVFGRPSGTLCVMNCTHQTPSPM